jgi:hypothetical protein
MQSICESLEQKELLRFWIKELTDCSPEQVDAVMRFIKERKTISRVDSQLTPSS